MARPMPVLPLVASTTVCPGFNVPLRSADSMTLSASRSFTEDAGLNASAFTYIRAPFGAILLTRMHGVFPTVSNTLSNKRPRPWVVPACGLGAIRFSLQSVVGCKVVLSEGGPASTRSGKPLGWLAVRLHKARATCDGLDPGEEVSRTFRPYTCGIFRAYRSERPRGRTMSYIDRN